MKNKNYKPQIDGLRALAVLPVIFFHAGFENFRGGFIGVDIFFVISGYLITSIIMNDLSKNDFKLQNFYLRRARRILPALLTVTLISSFFSVFLMTEIQLEHFSKQILSVIFFVSNFYFWKNSGYFSPSSEYQPLLHTWSLAVEEQFYIFFPIILIFLWKFFKNKIIFIILSIIFASLILAQFGGNFKLQNLSFNPPFLLLPFEFFWQAGAGNFYLPFGRVWELLIGSVVALNQKKIKGNDLLSLIGFCLIVFSIFSFSKNIQYPSIFTLIPAIGTFLIIINTKKDSKFNKLLSFKPLVYVGLISYSLYLWHQPILAFSRLYFGIYLSNTIVLFCLTISALLAFLSWKYLESPFRDKKKINDRKTIIYLLVLFIVILLTALLINFKIINTKKSPLPENILNTIQMEKNNDCLDLEGAHLKNSKKWFCEIGNKNINKIDFVLTGDSHALALKPAFDEVAKNLKIKGLMSGFSGCPHLLGIQPVRSDLNKKNCKLLNEKIFSYIKKNNVGKIFLVSRWTYYTDGDYSGREFAHLSKNNLMLVNKKNSRDAFIFGLERSIKKYNDIGVEVILVQQPPMQILHPQFIYYNSFNFKKLYVEKSKLYNLSVDYDKHIEFQSFVRNQIATLNKKYNFKIINLDEYFCDKKKCLIGDDLSSFYGDDDHLSETGSLKTQVSIKRHLID